jgi:wyosine [tRNA(Phe)-imidazoG37] synthetase (radical SAM superfamily)
MIDITDQNPIVSIRPYSNAFVVQWLMSRRCNFDCSYCPDIYHDQQAKDPDLSTMKQAWQRIMDSSRHLEPMPVNAYFLGGELTMNPDFLPFMTWLNETWRDRLNNIGFVTNGTASEKVYRELADICTWITFSTHSEFMSERKFFRNVLRTRDANPNCMITVNIMDEPWHQERVAEYERFLHRHGIRYYRHPILDFGDQRVPYPVRPYQRINFYENTR